MFLSVLMCLHTSGFNETLKYQTKIVKKKLKTKKRRKEGTSYDLSQPFLGVEVKIAKLFSKILNNTSLK